MQTIVSTSRKLPVNTEPRNQRNPNLLTQEMCGGFIQTGRVLDRPQLFHNSKTTQPRSVVHNSIVFEKVPPFGHNNLHASTPLDDQQRQQHVLKRHEPCIVDGN